MKIQPASRASRIILLVVILSLLTLVMVYAIQHPNLIPILVTVSWNG